MTNSTPASILYVENDKRIGMGGTTAPLTTVQIEDTTASTGITTLTIKGGAAQSTTNPYLYIRDENNNIIHRFFKSYFQANNIKLAGLANSTISGNNDEGQINLQNAASEAFTLQSYTNTTNANVFVLNARPNSTEALLQIQKAGTAMITVSNGGGIGIGVAATALLHMKAGTTSANTAPLKFTSGSNLTAAEAGAVEYDGTAFYSSVAASARGVSPSVQFAAIQSDFTLSASSGVQNCLTAANDTLTVAANTTYFFQGQYIINTGATTHTTALAFALAGSASVTSFEYTATTWSAAANTISTTPSLTHVSGVASKVINATSTAVYTIIKFQGVARMNAGGTIAPQINFSANPTGTNLMKVGSYITFYPVGSGSVAAVGQWA